MIDEVLDLIFALAPCSELSTDWEQCLLEQESSGWSDVRDGLRRQRCNLFVGVCTRVEEKQRVTREKMLKKKERCLWYCSMQVAATVSN